VISPELRGRIRRLFFVEHWKVGTIAAELGIHPLTVRRAIESEWFAPRSRTVRPSVLDPYKPFINATLEQYPRLRATRLYQMLQARGYSGSVIQLRRYVKTVRPENTQAAYQQLPRLPGEQARVDWGNFGKLPVGTARRTLTCFVIELSLSRAIYVRFSLDRYIGSFLRGHVAAFESFGGVPRELLYPHSGPAVTDRDGNVVRFHPRIHELAGYYQFAPRAGTVYREVRAPNTERPLELIRHSFFNGRTFDSITHLEAQVREWTAKIANTRPIPGHPEGLRVAEAFAREQPYLLPLPESPFPTDHAAFVRSGKTPYVPFDNNDYSIPQTLVGQPLTLLASETRVRIVDRAANVVADHPRSYDSRQRIDDPAHRPAPRSPTASSRAGRSGNDQ
jgi:transposase